MGTLLFREGMWPSVAFARDTWLKPQGQMIPMSCTLHMVPAAYGRYGSKVPLNMRDESAMFWQSMPYGLDFSSMVEYEMMDEEVEEDLDSLDLEEDDDDLLSFTSPRCNNI